METMTIKTISKFFKSLKNWHKDYEDFKIKFIVQNADGELVEYKIKDITISPDDKVINLFSENVFDLFDVFCKKNI